MSNLCFELTYLVKVLELSNIEKDKILVLKKEIKYMNNSSTLPIPEMQNSSIYLKFFNTDYNRNLTLCSIFLFLILLLLKTFEVRISEFLSEKFFENNEYKIEEKLEFNEFSINKFMTFQNVKFYLFYQQDSYFKIKFGNDFNPEYYDMVLIKHEVLDILRKDSDLHLKKLIIENLKNINKIKIHLIINLSIVLLLFFSFISSCLLLNSLKLEIGLLKSLYYFASIFFIILIIIIIIKLITKIEKSKNDLGLGNKYFYDNKTRSNGENDSLIVIEKHILK